MAVGITDPYGLELEVVTPSVVLVDAHKLLEQLSLTQTQTQKYLARMPAAHLGHTLHLFAG